MKKIAFKGKYGTLVQHGKVAGIVFSDKEIESFLDIKFDQSVDTDKFYPETIYTTAGKRHFGLDDYTIVLWSKAQLTDGKIETDVVSIRQHPDNIICEGKIRNKSFFNKLCNTLVPRPEDYDLVVDKNDHSITTEAGEVVLQNVFFENVEDAEKWKEQQEQEQQLQQEEQAITPGMGPDEDIPEVDFEDLIKAPFEDEVPETIEEGAEPGTQPEQPEGVE